VVVMMLRFRFRSVVIGWFRLIVVALRGWVVNTVVMEVFFL
jgi:hypothetical protein